MLRRLIDSVSGTKQLESYYSYAIGEHGSGPSYNDARTDFRELLRLQWHGWDYLG